MMNSNLLKYFLLISLFWGCISGMSNQLANACPRSADFPLVSDMASSGGNLSESMSNDSLYYARVFRKAHYELESSRVIFDWHIEHAINLVSQEGVDIMPYLLELAQGDRTRNGWPYWALLCGSIARIGGSEGLQMLIEIANDEDAADYVRYWAQNALSETVPSLDE